MEVSNCTDYEYNAGKLLNKLTGKVKANIINFNYTNPFASDVYYDTNRRVCNLVGKITNVHGTYMNDNIIFGVDETVKDALPLNYYIFTKTYRKMMQVKSDKALLQSVRTIVFFGHSLGAADYSYFQSIFDYFSLYDGIQQISRGTTQAVSSVTLRFYFYIYDTRKEVEIKRDAVDRVYKLIITYGNSLENKDRGKNLLHKLLLEERVQINFWSD